MNRGLFQRIAYTASNSPIDKRFATSSILFKVHVWEKEKVSGGVATSEDISGEGDLFVNDGVQGGATS